MGIISEIVTELTIKIFVTEIKKDLAESKNKPDVCAALKKLGRFALTKFEWSIPEWEEEYQKLFKE